ncbi:MAG: hydrolase [bacterium]
MISALHQGVRIVLKTEQRITNNPQETAFRPAWWLPGAHLQTLGGRVLRHTVQIFYERMTLQTPDDDFLAIDVADGLGTLERNKKGCVLLLHGLEGCSRSGYILTMVNALRSEGFACAVLNFRSCSGSPNRQPRFYHSGETQDLHFVVRNLTQRTGQPLSGIVGFSLGGNVLLKYLGENHGEQPLHRAAAVSVPFDLSAGADYLTKGLSRYYEIYFLLQLKRKIRLKEETYNHGIDLKPMNQIKTLREFDEVYTAPIHGFDSAEDYYTRSSSRRYIDSVTTPTLILNSKDDPIIPPRSIPTERITNNKFITAHITERGGHVGFIEGPHPLSVRYWAEKTVTQFLTD